MNQFLFSVGKGESANFAKPLTSFPADRRTDITQVEHASFTDAMKRAVTGVNVVTTDGKAGRFGLTVSAFSSVSAEPPLVLVCVNRNSPACAAILGNRRFCVNVLSARQKPIAENFAGMAGSATPYEFAEEVWTTARSGNPILEQAVARFDCTLATAIDAGTHTVFIGLVEAAFAGDDEPLLYTNQKFGRIEHSLGKPANRRNST
jgi:flavin reductase